MPRIGPQAGERGFGLVVAVVAMALAAMAALAIAAASRMAVIGESGDLARARAEAAADAGVAITLHHLAALDQTALAALDGRARTIALDQAQISVRVMDERGKIALGRTEDAVIARLLEQAGLSGGALAQARDSLLDWIDDDDQPRAAGAEAADYAARNIAPRNAIPLSIDELAKIRGFTPALVERLRPAITLEEGARQFDPAHAAPAAIAAATAEGDLSTAVIERSREAAGDQVAINGGDPRQLQGRPMTIAVDAQVPGGAVHREVIAVITGQREHPYEIHAVR